MNILKLSIAIILVTFSLTGCTALIEKSEDKIEFIDELSGMLIAPEYLHFEYERDGDEQTFRLEKCSGKLCGNGSGPP